MYSLYCTEILIFGFHIETRESKGGEQKNPKEALQPYFAKDSESSISLVDVGTLLYHENPCVLSSCFLFFVCIKPTLFGFFTLEVMTEANRTS